MNNELIADIWTVLLEQIPEKNRADAATEYVNVLLDHDVKESALLELIGVDGYLDKAIHYATDDPDDDYDSYFEDEEEEE